MDMFKWSAKVFKNIVNELSLKEAPSWSWGTDGQANDLKEALLGR